MPRLGAVRPSDGTPAFGDVVVRTVNAPKGDWSEDEAVDLLRQGYSVAHTARRTGYDERWLLAQQSRLD